MTFKTWNIGTVPMGNELKLLFPIISREPLFYRCVN